MGGHLTRCAHLLVVATLLATAACSSEDNGETEERFSICDNFETPYQAYSAGMTEVGEGELMQIKVLDADPAPPGRDDNTWMVQVLDMDDAPLPAASITEVKPWMPDHGHGATKDSVIGELDTEAKCEVSEIQFRMPGVWTVTFDVDTPDGPDRSVFGICIDG